MRAPAKPHSDVSQFFLVPRRRGGAIPAHREAAAVVPAGASVASICQPRDPTRETSLHREAFALLPGRKVLAAAVWDTPMRSEEKADYLIIAGPDPAPPPGRLLLQTPAGSVRRRNGR